MSLFVIYSAVDFIGFSDFAYKKVISKERGSLIIGTSRAAQALQPASINPILSKSGYLPVYNFAFTITDSPYGEVYFNAINRKLIQLANPSSKRVFVVCVDPFSLSSMDELDGKGLRENNGVLYGLAGCFRPNYPYLIKNLRLRKWLNESKYQSLHDDGWLEILVDSTDVGRNKQERIELYRSYTVNPSKERMAWLNKTIILLRGKGDVCLCRLSTCSEMNEIEEDFWPEFDKEMRSLAKKYGIGYFSFINDFNKYRTFDGNHIYRDDGKLISKALCDSILCMR